MHINLANSSSPSRCPTMAGLQLSTVWPRPDSEPSQVITMTATTTSIIRDMGKSHLTNISGTLVSLKRLWFSSSSLHALELERLISRNGINGDDLIFCDAAYLHEAFY